MGCDKGLLSVGGEPQVVRAARLLQQMCGRVVVSVRASQQDSEVLAQYSLVVDDPEQHGPAAGLLAAWRQAPDAALLVLAVDMPHVDVCLLERLVAERAPGLLATAFAHRDGTPEPLCSIWEPAAHAVVSRASRLGQGVSLRRVLQHGPARLLRPADPDKLRSVNTPAEFCALQL